MPQKQCLSSAWTQSSVGGSSVGCSEGQEWIPEAQRSGLTVCGIFGMSSPSICSKKWHFGR